MLVENRTMIRYPRYPFFSPEIVTQCEPLEFGKV